MIMTSPKSLPFSAFVLVVYLAGCRSPKKESIFDSLKDKTDVSIYLKRYGLEAVPSDISVLKNAKRLFIARDTGGWTMYPPLSALPSDESTRHIGHLPDEITELTNLTSLSLVSINLTSLPADFDRLEQLDTLVLFDNRLKISSEMGKLKRLKRLKYLGLLGNYLTVDDLLELKQLIPGITIMPDLR